MKTASPLLLPLLRSKTQGNMYARLFLDPGTSRSVSDLANEVGASSAQTMREVNRLVDAGLVSTVRRGNSRMILVETDNPVFRPMAHLLAVTFGPVPVLAGLLEGVDGVEEAFIYGSWAARYAEQPGPVPDDIDVLVIGSPDKAQIYNLTSEAEKVLRRDVQIRTVTRDSWSQQHDSAFRRTIENRPMVDLVTR